MKNRKNMRMVIIIKNKWTLDTCPWRNLQTRKKMQIKASAKCVPQNKCACTVWHKKGRNKNIQINFTFRFFHLVVNWGLSLGKLILHCRSFILSSTENRVQPTPWVARERFPLFPAMSAVIPLLWTFTKIKVCTRPSTEPFLDFFFNVLSVDLDENIYIAK